MQPKDSGFKRGHAADDAGTVADPDLGPEADEEAQLLPIEELEIEDSPIPFLSRKARKPGILGWLGGPQPPRIQIVKPFFPFIQELPSALLNRLLPRGEQRIVALAAFSLLWAIVFFSFLARQLPIKDGMGEAVVNLDCVDSVWRRKNDCGIDGVNCRPFSNISYAFRCPAHCASVRLLNSRAIGAVDVNYRPLVIGDQIYRGDSFICGSAIHSGVITDTNGGCGRISLVGENDDYPGTRRHGIESIPFDSYFPLSFNISTDDRFRCPSSPRQALLVVSVLFTSLVSCFASSPKIFFLIFTLIFTHVAFASDPPSASFHNVTVLPDHLSMFAKRLLPASFPAVIMYLTTVRRTLSGLNAQMEKTLLWLGGFWFGALSNYTFDWIPISRLTTHDLEQQPGAKVALAIILVILVAVIAGQVYYFWLEGRLLQYLALYGLFILAILGCLIIPGVNLRIHHYILALLLLPGTSLQTRPSLLYQGILLGLFVNGIARWGFDSVLQTTDALRGDGKWESSVPKVLAPVISFTAESITATFSWASSPVGVHGISVLVNDVERDRAFFDDALDGDLGSFQWTRPIGMAWNEYIRFAYVRDGQTLDYTKPGTLFSNGSWTMTQEQ